ncbi:MAG: glycosyltransferase [Gemmatimonadales bacterium]|nr:MAG: glycosyltransferase [Gemmatimonadales bacterium]
MTAQTSTVLLYTSPARGHLYPMMDVALELHGRGHHVVVQTLAAEADTVRAAGVEHRPINPRIEAIELDDFRAGHPIAALRRTFECWLARAPFEIQDLARAVHELAPDLLLVDTNSWGASAFAEGSGRRWAGFLPYVLPVPSRDAPAFGPGFPPPRGPLHRVRDRMVHGALRLGTRRQVRALNVLRSQVGAEPLRAFTDLFLRPDPLLYRSAPPFDYPRSDLPPSIQPIGPGLWAPPGEVPGWLHDLPRPRILVSVSTEFQADGAIIEMSLEAFGDDEGSLIVTTAALDPSRFRAPNDRTRIVRFLPHGEVIPHVDLVITHGGMGTTQRALAAGVPVCAIPWGRDQMETGRRVEVSGAGRLLPRGQLDPRRLREASLDGLTRRGRAAEVADAFRAAGGANRAADLLEDGWRRAGGRLPERQGARPRPPDRTGRP